MSSTQIRLLVGAALATVALLGCQFDPSGLAPFDGAAADSAPLPDGAEAGVGPDGGGGCVNGEQRCYREAVQLCVAGTWIDDTVCPWGCNSSVPNYPNCGSPLWAETVDPITDVGTGHWIADSSLTGVTVIDTDASTITTPTGPLTAHFEARTHYRSGGLPDVVIMGFTSITIPVGARVEVVGSRPLALVAYESIIVGGELMAQGQNNGSAGAGGYPGGLSGGPGQDTGGGAAGARSGTGVLKSGAGGGAFTGPGGSGGSVPTPSIPGGSGGTVVSVDPLDGPLVGGHGGGASAEDLLGGNSAPGGGGGGALMLAAQISVEVLATGVVNVGGGGGRSTAGGGGGGSGGMVLIQTHTCIVEGVVAANGGGGGDLGGGDPGFPGSSDDLPTPGGGTYGGTGGAGSALGGGDGTTNNLNGGGGGGGAGFVRIDTVTPPDVNTGTISPHEGTAGHAQNAFPTL